MEEKDYISGCVHNVTQHGGFTTILIKTNDAEYGRTYTGPKYRNYDRWQPLKIGDPVNGLRWFNKDKGLLDADSPVHLNMAI